MKNEEDEDSAARLAETMGNLDLDNPKTLTNFKDIYDLDQVKNQPQKKARDLKEGDDQKEKEEFFMM